MKKAISLIIVFTFVNTILSYCQPGTLDGDFNSDGKVTTDFYESNDKAYAIAIQPDGKIISAGFACEDMGGDFALSRYLPDGSLDLSFGTDGRVTTTFGANDDICESVALQPDGKIVAAGFLSLGGSSVIGLARYNPDGNLDETFSSDGMLGIAIGENTDVAKAVAVQPDGKIIIAGYADNGVDDEIILLRFLSDGSIDTDFGTHGLVVAGMGSGHDHANAMALQPDGKIVIAGYSYNGTDREITLIRYNTDGSLDENFSYDGIVTTSVGLESSEANAMAIQPDGKIIVGGFAYNEYNKDFALVRYNTDGSLDLSFGTNGKLITPVGKDDEIVNSVAVQPDGKIIAAGEAFNITHSNFAMMRYNEDGSVDNTFGIEGEVITLFGDNTNEIKAMAIQPNGRIVVAGHSYNSETNNDFALARYLSGLNLGIIDFSTQKNLLLIYPNPIQDEAILKYELLKEENISLELYDMQGRLMQTFLSHEKRLAGSHEEVIRIDHTIPEGNYILVISNDTGKQSIKIIK